MSWWAKRRWFGHSTVSVSVELVWRRPARFLASVHANSLRPYWDCFHSVLLELMLDFVVQAVFHCSVEQIAGCSFALAGPSRSLVVSEIQ